MKHVKLFENFKKDIKQYIEDNNIQPNSEYPKFLYHATDKELDDFFLDADIDWEDVDGNGAWDIVMPSGYIFLTDDLREARGYGRYIIPFELTSDDIYTHKTYSDQPSIDFDNDYNYEHVIWEEFEDSMADTLEMKGHHKSTFISMISVLNPRIDIAKKFYNKQ
jgi:hypothetical protein